MGALTATGAAGGNAAMNAINPLMSGLAGGGMDKAKMAMMGAQMMGGGPQQQRQQQMGQPQPQLAAVQPPRTNPRSMMNLGMDPRMMFQNRPFSSLLG